PRRPHLVRHLRRRVRRSAPAVRSPSMTLEAPFPGAPRFELIRQLGTGGMGIVYEVLDHERQARVALKTLRPLAGGALVRLQSEFRALQGLQHRNLVGLLELISSEGRWFFTMELVEGVSFRAWVRDAPDPIFDDTRSGDADPPPSPRASDGACDEGKLRAAL